MNLRPQDILAEYCQLLYLKYDNLTIKKKNTHTHDKNK
jgi:hypothetical protein